jgi:hypothetical protein
MDFEQKWATSLRGKRYKSLRNFYSMVFLSKLQDYRL